MDIAMTAPRSQAPKQRSGLSKLVVGALIGFAFMLSYLQAILIKQIVMPLPIISVLSLVLAALIAGRPVGGWRWTPLGGSVWSVVVVLNNLNHIRYELAHPENTHQFAWQLIMLAFMATTIVAGIGATVHNYRRPVGERRLPRWVLWGFTALAGLLVGAVTVAAIPQTGHGVQVNAAVLAQFPAIPLDVFTGGELRVKARELTALRLENPDTVGHSFDVDELNVHVAMPSDGESLALFTANAPGTYTFYCAPHYNKATRQGMHGTLIVEP
jgi:heme/copper-type cytochrome/quinol oxidase subunit 2